MAEVYDLLMDDANVPGWIAFMRGLLARGGVRAGRVCDAACGTGALALSLAGEYDVVGVDISPAMLRVAQERSRASGKAVRWIRQDIARLELPAPVDAVASMNDGLNYLETPERAASFIRHAARALRPGGVFVFDVSTPHKLRNILGDKMCAEERDEVTYLWQNAWDESARRVRMDLTFFVREPDGRYRRFEETHVQRAHSLEEIGAWLEEAGFDAEAFGDRKLRPPVAADLRWFFLARRR